MASKTKGKAAKVVLLTIGGVSVLTVGTVSAVASKYEPLIAPHVEMSGIRFDGLTKEQAKEKLESWWNAESNSKVTINAPDLTEEVGPVTLTELGVNLNLDASVAQLPTEDFWSNSVRKFGGTASQGKSLKARFQLDGSKLDSLRKFVDEHQPEHAKAKVDFVGGKIVRTPEQAGLQLDSDALVSQVDQIVQKREIELPLIKGSQHVRDADLEKITEVMSTYTSHFSEGNANRASNIHNAARRLTGTVLLPGETFSFNGTLGQRTAKNGFKLAGVYNNGKHDFDIGGGICQVSGTLYNATLLANLKIVRRSCHTYPVPYLPVGRDATVSFPNPDFEFKNSTDSPIAISAVAGAGTLTFKVLGIKDPTLEVKIETSGHSTWSRGEKVVKDMSLPPGKRVVEEKGGPGHRITTTRYVYRNGKLQEREDLGTSIYNGGPRIVRMNPNPATVPVHEVQAKPVDDESPDGGAPLTVPPTGHMTNKPVRVKH